MPGGKTGSFLPERGEGIVGVSLEVKNLATAQRSLEEYGELSRKDTTGSMVRACLSRLSSQTESGWNYHTNRGLEGAWRKEGDDPGGLRQGLRWLFLQVITLLVNTSLSHVLRMGWPILFFC